ncbi:MAG: CDGSH iron-sulfur domain-containing protein [Planctomycetota bacterium]
MSDVSIQVRTNGPFKVTGAVTLTDGAGRPFNLAGKPEVYLCRCGQSKNMPFCDGSHKACGFKSEVVAK